MRNRIQQLFLRKKQDILSVYFTAGYPQLHDTISIIQELDIAGVDMIEIGFPFSDPLADGPIIQQSSMQAIKNKMSLNLLFTQLKDIRAITQMPLIMMGYLNPVLQYGEHAFIEKCNEMGIDGIIIPDMPMLYYQAVWKEKCRANHLSNILLITPETKESRIQEIDQQSDTFIYMVSSNSITGSNKTITNQTDDYFKRIMNMQLIHPTLIGFGIHNKNSFANACTYSNGAIIGSAFIKHISAKGISTISIQQFVNNIRP